LRLTSEELQVESFLAWEAEAAVLPCRAAEEEVVVVAAGAEELACCRRLGLNQSILWCCTIVLQIGVVHTVAVVGQQRRLDIWLQA